MVGTEEEEDDDDSVRAVVVVFSRAVWPPPSPVPVAIRPSCIPADRQTGVPPPARRPRAHALLSRNTYTLLRALALFLAPRLSICPSHFLSREARARSGSFFFSLSIARFSLSVSLSLVLLVCARSCYPPLFLLLRSPRRPAPSERTETTPSLSTKHRYITQQRHHTRPRKNEPRADY